MYSAREFVWWYNGHPAYRDLPIDLTRTRSVAIAGLGNVAGERAACFVRPALAWLPPVMGASPHMPSTRPVALPAWLRNVAGAALSPARNQPSSSSREPWTGGSRRQPEQGSAHRLPLPPAVDCARVLLKSADDLAKTDICSHAVEQLRWGAEWQAWLGHVQCKLRASQHVWLRCLARTEGHGRGICSAMLITHSCCLFSRLLLCRRSAVHLFGHATTECHKASHGCHALIHTFAGAARCARCTC